MMNLNRFMIHLLIQNDQYFVLRDFDSYVSTHKEVERNSGP